MKILMLSWEYSPNVVGGLGRHVSELAPALAQQGIDLHVVTPSTKPGQGGRTVENNVTVHRVLMPTIMPKANIYEHARDINKRLKDYIYWLGEDFDLLHDHDWLTGFAGVDLQKTLARPLVATIHATERGRSRGHVNNDLQRSIDNAEGYLIEKAEHLVVCSKHMASEVQYFFQVQSDKLDVIPNGVNLSDLRNGYSPAELTNFRQRYADPNDQIIFTISRLVYEKGVHLLVQAMPAVLAECPRARLIIAGRGPEAENLKQQAEVLGVSGRINFIGFISDEERNHLFKVADCAVFPSLYEPFGIVALEAMALKCPLVVSDVGGFAEMVKHAETGIKIYPDNVDSTVWGITHALNNPEWAKQHTVRAAQSVAEYFNWYRIARLTKAVYDRVLDESETVETKPESI